MEPAIGYLDDDDKVVLFSDANPKDHIWYAIIPRLPWAIREEYKKIPCWWC
jgi:hypothetical protein